MLIESREREGNEMREKAAPFAPVIALLLLLADAAVFGLYLGWALIVGAILFALDAKRQRHTWNQVGHMLAQGLQKAWIVVRVLLIIGLLTASWIACGAIPCLVRLGALLIRPHVFLLCAFWLCAIMSFLLGTSFGTANTMGVVMITLARAGGVSLPMTAGAILCGIYIGDRCSPMSSSLLLLSTLTETELYDNVGMTVKSMLAPFVAASGGYLICSFFSPLSTASTGLAEQLEAGFDLNPVVLLPTAVVFVLCLMRKPVKLAMAVSVMLACLLAVFFQGMPILDLVKTLIFGYHLPETEPLSAILHGGGLSSMLTSIIIVTSSCAIAGIVEGTDLASHLGGHTGGGHLKTYLKTLATGFVTAAIGCNQTIAIVLTHAVRKEAYQTLGNRAFARDMSFAGTLAPVLIPWCIAAYTPTSQLDVHGIGWMPFAFWLWLMLLWQGLCAWRADRKRKSNS